LIVGLIIWLFSKLNYGVIKKGDFLVQFSYATEDESSSYIDVLRKYCRTFNLVNLRSISPDKMEISYYVKLKDKAKARELIRELNQIKGVNQVNLFADEGGV